MAIEILLFSNDLALAKNISASSKNCVEQISVHPCTTFERLRQLRQKIAFEFLFIDESFHSTEVRAMLSSDKLRGIEGNRIASILLSSKAENSEIQEMLDCGYTDIVLKPVDLSILLHKIDVYRPNVKTLKEDLLFKMDVDGEIGLMLTARIVQASEFGAILRSDMKLEINDIIKISPRMFESNSGAYDGEDCIARVNTCLPSIQSKQFDSKVTFIAPGPRFMTAMRLWMRKQFIVSTDSKASKE